MLQAYLDSQDHLRQELNRLDLMLRRAVLIARSAASPQIPDELRGAVITEPQIDAWVSRTDLLNDYWIRQAAAADVLRPVDSRLSALRREIDERVALTSKTGTGLSLLRLAECFGLSPAEVDLLLVALAPELEPGYETLFAYLQDDATRKRPSVDLSLNLICRSASEKAFARRLLTGGAALVHYHLIELVEEPGDRQSTLLRRFMKLDESVLRFVLAPVPESIPVETNPETRVAALGLEDPAESQLLKLIDALQRDSAGAQPVIQLISSPQQPPLEVAEIICQSVGRKPMPIMLAELISSSSRALVAVRDAALAQAILVIQSGDAPAQDSDRQKLSDAEKSLWNALTSTRVPVILMGPATAFTTVPGDADLWRLGIPSPSFEQRKKSWDRVLKNTPAAASTAQLADAFSFSNGMIRQTAQLASRLAQLGPSATVSGAAANASTGTVTAPSTGPTFDHILAAARSLATPNLTRFALPVVPRYELSDILLPREKKQQLTEIISRVNNRELVHREWGFGDKLSRGKGLTVLFTGPSGTGKTMAAEVLAGQLSLILYQIDLSTVISKYIGETEQHLGAIFREAESSQVLLFFDEAEACFGKRTEVKDAHDRYANIEVNYLLQRLEQYEGIVVLATNLYRNLDEAFLRRISDVIEFPLPDEPLREQIWRKHFPDKAVVSRDPNRAIDFPFLAKHFKLTGGNIKNITLSAAFAAAPKPIDMGHVVRAIRAEHQKMGKLTIESDFGKYFTLLQEKPQ